MGLIKYGLAVGIGYHFGQPHGRQQLLRLRQEIGELARKPAIMQLRERGWDIAGECALAAKNLASRKLSGKSKVADADATMAVDDTDRAAPPGFGGRTVAEDSQAAISGIIPPPPAARVPPADPTGRP